MDTKLKADIAESAVRTELLKRSFRVLKPVGDRLPYDLALDLNGKLLRIQVKCAWYDSSADAYMVDARRTKTNRKRMLRGYYGSNDFDFAIVYIDKPQTFYVMPVFAFLTYKGTISFIVTKKRQRRPKSATYREKWDLLSEWAAQPVTAEQTPVKFGEALTGNTEPSSPCFMAKRCRD